jgi:hypothetical protein
MCAVMQMSIFHINVQQTILRAGAQNKQQGSAHFGQHGNLQCICVQTYVLQPAVIRALTSCLMATLPWTYVQYNTERILHT